LGPGGVEGRVGRHLRRFALGGDGGNGSKAPVRHWHVDYLHPSMAVVAVVAAESGERLECRLTRALGAAGAHVVDGFGATDCREGCGGHLLRLGEMSANDAVAAVCGAFRRMGLRPVIIFPP
ncbi:MAG TPA: DUF123 domain-containing protein, partial [Candidatus Methanomethylicus sp.]|nr:DUF123 domain-containing protein [Candidatus Methanomethylicus sp.]